MIGIFGAAGAIGKAVAPELRRRGQSVRVVGRRAETLEAAFGEGYEIVAADLGEPSDAARAARGLEAIVHTVGVPYNRFALHPLLMQRAVDAARAESVRRLLVVSNVYSYAVPQTPRVAETHSREPHTYKGRMRKQQEDIALSAHSDALRTLVLRLPDFFGPDAGLSVAAEVFKAARDGKPAPVFAPIDKPHEWIYTPDVGPVVAGLLARDDAFGGAYNLAGPGTLTQREFAVQVFKAFGRELKLQVVSSWMLRLAGLVNPIMREFVEMQYLYEHPLILDDTKLTRTLGAVAKTAYAEGITRTAQSYRH